METRILQKLPGPILNQKVQKRQGCVTKMANSKFGITRKEEGSLQRIPQSKRLATLPYTFANPGAGLHRNRCEDVLILGADQLQPLLGMHGTGSSTQRQSNLLDDAPG